MKLPDRVVLVWVLCFFGIIGQAQTGSDSLWYAILLSGIPIPRKIYP